MKIVYRDPKEYMAQYMDESVPLITLFTWYPDAINLGQLMDLPLGTLGYNRETDELYVPKEPD